MFLNLSAAAANNVTVTGFASYFGSTFSNANLTLTSAHARTGAIPSLAC